MLAGFALAALIATGCSDDDDSSTTTTATSEEPTTTTDGPTTTERAATSTSCPDPGGVAVATFDLDGDGVDERLVDVGQGASVDILELRRLDGCTEVPVLLDRSPAQFAIGGTVLLLQGLRCEDEVLVHLGATSEDGETYATLDLLYELRAGELVRIDDRSGTLSVSDPALADYGALDC